MYFYPEQSIALVLSMTPAEINRMVALRIKRQTDKPLKFATMAEYEEWKSNRAANDG